MRRLVHRLAVGAGDEPAARQAVDAGQVGAGEDGDDARRRLRLRGVDRADRRVRVRRAQEVRMRLPRHRHVVGVLARARQEARVFLAQHRLADHAGKAGRIVRAHRRLLFAHRGGALPHGLDDVVIAGAAAEVAVELGADRRFVGAADAGSRDRSRSSPCPACRSRIAGRGSRETPPASDASCRLRRSALRS